MRLLGVDTSSAYASVAIVENGRIISEKFDSQQYSVSSGAGRPRINHSEILLPLIESALTTAAVSLGDISGFVVVVGPGSFTGLRIGLSTVSGLAYGTGIPVAGISTLHAHAARIGVFKGAVCAILDARKKEVYAAIFRACGGVTDRLTEDAVMSVEGLLEKLRVCAPTEPIMLTGTGVSQYGDRMVKSLGSQLRVGKDEPLPTLAAAAALLTEARFAAGTVFSPSSLAPRYLRLSEAEMKSKNVA